MAYPKGAPRPPGSGRKKGTPNKTSSGMNERAKALGIDLFETLCLFAKGDWEALGYSDEFEDGGKRTISIQQRLYATAEALQYVAAKRRSVEVLDNQSPEKGEMIYEASWGKNENIRDTSKTNP